MTKQLTITLSGEGKFTAPIVNSERSKLGKRGITGGVEVDLTEIPEKVLRDLLMTAVTDYMQLALKNVDQDKATVEDCQEAMTGRLEMLKTGTKTAERKAGTRDPIKAAARVILKKAIQAGSEEKLDGKTLTTAVAALFKSHTTWAKTKDAEVKEALADQAQLVEEALAQAREAAKKQDKMNKTLIDVLKQAQASTASAAKEAPAPKATAAKGKKRAPAASGPTA